MFCFQCQETAKNTGCTVKGICGKPEETANFQDLLIFVLKGISVYGEKLKELGAADRTNDDFIAQGLFATITNANWDDARFTAIIQEGLQRRDQLKATFLAAYKEKNGSDYDQALPEAATWVSDDPSVFAEKAKSVGVLATENEDVRSLRELLTIGLKGIAAYADHASILGFQKNEINDFIMEALASTTKDLTVDEMLALVMKAGETAVSTMALLDEANTTSYGDPEITEVNIGVGSNPGILISGHDLKDMEELLKQTEDTGVDVYTHGEMLPTNYYPAFKKYDHFVGNYGGSWWHQNKEFESFNGPILLTTNCLVPLKKNNTYLDRLFTTGVVGYEGAVHIANRHAGDIKDFSAIIEKAKTCSPPTEIETGTIVGGFAHNQVITLADKVVDAVKSGAIKRFVVMAGCDGRQKSRTYYTEVAENLPKDTVIRISENINLPHVTFGDSNNLSVGEPVATVGYLGRLSEIPRPRLTPTVFGGIIKAANLNGIAYCSVCPDSWSTDTGNNMGNSGALLLNRQGEVVGVEVAIVTQSHEARTVGFAIPSNTAVRIAEKIISYGNVKGG